MKVQIGTPARGIPQGSVDDRSPETMPFRLAYRRTAGLYPFESQEFLLRVVLGTQPQFSGFRGKSAIFDGVCHQLMKEEADRDRSTRRDADIEVPKMRKVTARQNERGQFTNGQIPQNKIDPRGFRQ